MAVDSAFKMLEDDPENLIPCDACGAVMDLSEVGPFTNVACPACGEHHRVKREFGPYRLERRHSVGGMSMVFVAVDSTLGREVAVKILSEEYSSVTRRMEAFEQEARITASISHPNVVRVFTTGRAFGRFYIAMELVPGGHFEQPIRDRGRIPEDECLPLAVEVASGLQAAKAAGLIHRDVKPGNILLDANGSAKLVDFGLALVTQEGMAKASEFWATPYYVPPETVEGHVEDFRSDIYAFGATFYHALAGVPPCDEESMDTLRLRQAKMAIQPLREVAPWVSEPTAKVIDRCMAYRPGDRYSSYEELLAALRAASRGENPSEGLRTPRTRRAASRTEKIAMVAGGLLGIAAIAMLGVNLLNSSPASTEVATPSSPTPSPGPDSTDKEEGLPRPVPSLASGIVRSYREAEAALLEDRFDEARGLYGEVRDHPEVMQPTGMQAACEAVACAWLAGESAQAREELRAGLEHIRGADTLDPAMREACLDAFAALVEFPPVRVFPTTGDSSLDHLLLWLAALKDWDQGRFDMARPMLEELAKADDETAVLARRYLSDDERLRTAEPENYDLPPEEARQRADALGELDRSLATQGRASFHVRTWRLGMTRAAVKPVEPKGPAEPDVPEDVWGNLRGLDYQGATEALSAWSPPTDDAEKSRQLLMSLIQDAESFLKGLESRRVAAEGTVQTRDGRSFPRVLRGEEGGIVVATAAGKEWHLGWSELSADALIALHRVAASSSGDGADWHEQAFAFDYLSGDPQRAKTAVAKWLETSTERAEFWDQVFRRIPR
ncbi:serine/threonine protein kinase [Haloferula luteola]|uniref:Serine/threonine protein kinase n=1 Tax=Haloferula luteola TaxID=595692 RepID=A0A840UXQ1_9BACT|nr:serine/threonine-protein kinase [Haloferula luteola]MBB5350505.1 serine/threonine protein kinase [Haloferula luteola]